MKWLFFFILFLPLLIFAQMMPLEREKVPKYLYKWVPLAKIWKITNNFLSRGHYPIHLTEFSEIVFHRPRLNLPETLHDLNDSPLLIPPEYSNLFFPRDHDQSPLALIKFKINTNLNAQVVQTPLTTPLMADEFFNVQLVKHLHDGLFVEWVVTSPKAIIDFTADPKILVPEVEALVKKLREGEPHFDRIHKTQPPELWFNYLRSYRDAPMIVEIYKKNISKVPKYLRRPMVDCSTLEL